MKTHHQRIAPFDAREFRREGKAVKKEKIFRRQLRLKVETSSEHEAYPLAVGRNIESFPQHVLLHNRSTILVLLLKTTLAEDLLFRLDVERSLEELLVEERNTSFKTPSHC